MPVKQIHVTEEARKTIALICDVHRRQTALWERTLKYQARFPYHALALGLAIGFLAAWLIRR